MKETLKNRIKHNQNGRSTSGEKLPEETRLYDTHRKVPKRHNGTYTDENTVVVLPIEHMEEHGTLRVREKDEEELKRMVDDRNQFLKLKLKINNQILAAKRGVDGIEEATEQFLMAQLEHLEPELSIREKRIEKKVLDMAKTNPFVSACISVHGVGPLTVADCLVYIDLTKADHASSLWKYTGLHAAKHDRYEKGIASGGNRKLRTRLFIMADVQVKCRGPYRDVYDRTKARLSESDRMVKTMTTGGIWREMAWKDVKPCHRNGAGLRAIMKHFLADYWYVGRTLAGLPTTPIYAESILGSGHRTIMPEERGWKYLPEHYELKKAS